MNGSLSNLRRPRFALALKSATAAAVLWTVYVATSIGTSGDSRWVVPGALSLLREGNLDLDEYEPALRAADYYAVEKVDGHYYSIFPCGVTLLAVPFTWAGQWTLDVAVHWAPSLEARLRPRLKDTDMPLTVAAFYWRVEQGIASLFMAMEVILFYLLVRRQLPARDALLLALALAFCTSVWSIGATALWQHGPSLLLLTLALYLLLDAQTHPRRAALAGAVLAFAYIVRPTNALPLALFGLYVLLQHRRVLPGFILCAASILVPFAFYNLNLYGSALPPYYLANRLSFHPALAEGLAGNLISPARGLFVYSPVLTFALMGMGLSLKRRGPNFPLDCTLVAIVLLHWLAISAFPHWWGGASYGPRLFTDMTPFLVWFIIPALQAAGSATPPERWTLRAAFVVFAAVSLWMQWRGASDMGTWAWNLSPEHIDLTPERLWQWQDPPFLR